MNRRDFVLAAGSVVLNAASPTFGTSVLAKQSEGPFSRTALVALARDRAKHRFQPPSEVPAPFAELGYDQYRDIHFKKELAFWSGEQRGFTLELLHAGFIYAAPVDIHLVEDGIATPIPYSSHFFDFGPNLSVPTTHDQPLFSGIRLRFPINTPDVLDEVAVFQGGSYFRSLGEGQVYGASARALAIDTGAPTGEEFPFFRSFWIERPDPGTKTAVVHALTDSPRSTGAFTFHIWPGHSTLMEVEATLFAREELPNLGLAPLTSMYLFGPMERSRFPDHRVAVHDSDALAIAERAGRWTLRSLANPKMLQISSFMADDCRGFGLQQRADDYVDYKDLEARYELRPNIWVEPKRSFGEGKVQLVEIPTDREFNDNIVAFWRPTDSLPRGESLSYAYWLQWGAPVFDGSLALVSDARGGLTLDHKRRLFVVDFAPPVSGSETAEDVFAGTLAVEVSASAGVLGNVVGQLNRETGGYRASFELDVSGVDLSELHLLLTRENEPISETWLYRWTEDGRV
jgi:periplasmic glucans biosynthesis protein